MSRFLSGQRGRHSNSQCYDIDEKPNEGGPHFFHLCQVNEFLTSIHPIPLLPPCFFSQQAVCPCCWCSAATWCSAAQIEFDCSLVFSQSVEAALSSFIKQDDVTQTHIPFCHCVYVNFSVLYSLRSTFFRFCWIDQVQTLKTRSCLILFLKNSLNCHFFTCRPSEKKKNVLFRTLGTLSRCLQMLQVCRCYGTYTPGM